MVTCESVFLYRDSQPAHRNFRKSCLSTPLHLPTNTHANVSTVSCLVVTQ